MLNFLGSLISPLFNIADKLVMDKDKYAELQFKRTELKHKARMELLKVTTTPNMDAIVKLLITINDVVLPLLRPLGSFGLAGFAAYCSLKGIELDPMVQTMLFGSPLAWGASRHVNKQTKEKTRQVEVESEYDWDEDD